MALPVVDSEHPRFIALQMVNTMLGGSFSSRITSNIREDKGYTYSPRSRIFEPYGGAIWYQQADVTSEHTADSIAEILKEITRMRTELPGAEELEGFKRYTNGIFVLRNSDRNGIINQLAYHHFKGLPVERLGTMIEEVNALDTETIMEVAKEFIDPSKMTIVIVGDLESVRKQVADEPLLVPFTTNSE